MNYLFPRAKLCALSEPRIYWLNSQSGKGPFLFVELGPHDQSQLNRFLKRYKLTRLTNQITELKKHGMRPGPGHYCRLKNPLLSKLYFSRKLSRIDEPESQIRRCVFYYRRIAVNQSVGQIYGWTHFRWSGGRTCRPCSLIYNPIVARQWAENSVRRAREPIARRPPLRAIGCRRHSIPAVE